VGRYVPPGREASGCWKLIGETVQLAQCDQPLVEHDERVGGSLGQRVELGVGRATHGRPRGDGQSIADLAHLADGYDERREHLVEVAIADARQRLQLAAEPVTDLVELGDQQVELVGRRAGRADGGHGLIGVAQRRVEIDLALGELPTGADRQPLDLGPQPSPAEQSPARCPPQQKRGDEGGEDEEPEGDDEGGGDERHAARLTGAANAQLGRVACAYSQLGSCSMRTSTQSNWPLMTGALQ